MWEPSPGHAFASSIPRTCRGQTGRRARTKRCRALSCPWGAAQGPPALQAVSPRADDPHLSLQSSQPLMQKGTAKPRLRGENLCSSRLNIFWRRIILAGAHWSASGGGEPGGRSRQAGSRAPATRGSGRGAHLAWVLSRAWAGQEPWGGSRHPTGNPPPLFLPAG